MVLFNLYAKSKEPYLTVIRLWDNQFKNLLCAKYDPICIGSGEVGMNDDMLDDNSSCTSSKIGRKRKAIATTSAFEVHDVLKSIQTLCDNHKTTPIATNIQEKKKKGIDFMTLDDLYKAVEQYKRQLKFLEEMGSLSETEKIAIVEKTKVLFEEINKRTSVESEVS